MKLKTIVIEPNMNGPAHSEINTGLLTIIQNIHFNNKLILIADDKHIHSIKQKMNLTKWELNEIKVLPYSPKYLLINEFIFIYRAIRLIFKKDFDTIYFLGILPLSHVVISILNTFLKRNIIIALHGQMEALLPNTRVGKTRYYYKLSKPIFKKNDGIRYIVFGESIKQNIKHLFKADKIICIDQPYSFPAILNTEHPKRIKLPVTIGIVGRADKNKNIHELFKLIDYLKQDILDGMVKIKVVGKLSVPVPDNYSGLLEYFTDTISDDTFKSEITTLDFALSFTDQSYYRAIPSGVLFDCIKWNLPVLGLKNDYIKYYFKTYGEFGKLFENTIDIAKFVHHLSHNIEDYQKNQDLQFRETFLNMRESLNIENIGKHLSVQL